MSFYPENPNLGQRLGTDAPGVTVDKAFFVHLAITAAQAATASTTAVHAAVTDTGVDVVVTTGITAPPYARNITATSGGTAADIKAVQVIITGTDIGGNVITETLPIFTVNTATTVVGAKAFKTVTSIAIPAHDGTGATTAIGFGDVLGLPDKLAHNTLLRTFLANVLEATAATVTTSTTALSGNTIDLNSALNGTAVDAYYLT